MLHALLFILASLVIYFVKVSNVPRNFPPGPKPLPIIGNLHTINTLAKKLKGQHEAFAHLASKFKTNVLGLKLGSELLIVVFSHSTIHKVLTESAFEGRPNTFFFKLRCMGKRRGISTMDGPFWVNQRSFLVRHLKNCGFGKEPMEAMIRSELTDMINEINSINQSDEINRNNGINQNKGIYQSNEINQNNGIDQNKPAGQSNKIIPKGNNFSKGIKINELIAPSIVNVLWWLTTGQHLSRNDEILLKFLNLFSRRSKAFQVSSGWLSAFPFLRFLAPDKTGYNLVKKINADLKEFFLVVIRQHLDTWTEGNEDNFIYAFISRMKKGDQPSIFTEEQLIMVCLDVFFGGADTTSSTLNYAFLLMLLYPEVQEKVQRNIDEHLGSIDEISYSDRKKVPYIEAVLHESQRLCHVMPIAGPRRVLQDTILDGYDIPKETTVLFSLKSINMDEKIWEDPENFRPERFLDEKGQFSCTGKFIPFSLGKRRCLGEILARSCIFIIFVGLLKKFSIKPEPASQQLNLTPVVGMIATPMDYTVEFIERY